MWRSILRRFRQMMRHHERDKTLLTARGVVPRRPVPFLFRHRSFLFALFAVLFCATCFFYLLVAYQRPLRVDPTTPIRNGGDDDNQTVLPWQYTIVVDAGSSGSRLLVYKRKANAQEQRGSSLFPSLLTSADRLRRDSQQPKVSGLPEFIKVGDELSDGDDTCAAKITPGISSFETRPLSGIPAYMNTLLCRAQKIVPPEAHHVTPFYLLATAGMRLLTEERQAAIHASVCQHIQTTTAFQIKNCADQILTISGETEGLYGWFAINYLKKTLEDPRTTFGFLDMGGASAQLAYVPDERGIRQHLDDLESVALKQEDGRVVTYPIYTKTFLGFGANQAYKQHEALHRKLHANDSCSPLGLPLAGYLEGEDSDSGWRQRPPLMGVGDMSACLQQTQVLINKEALCPSKPCLFNGIHYPGIDFAHSAFIGVSEYWYTAQSIFDLGGRYDAAEWYRHMAGFCTSRWSDILDEFHYGNVTANAWLKGKHQKWTQADVTEERLKTQCFKAAWIYTLLHEGFEFPKEAPPEQPPEAGEEDKAIIPSLQSMDNVDGQPISWALGAVLMLTCAVPVDTLHLQRRHAVPILFILFALLSMYAIFTYLARRQQHRARHITATAKGLPYLHLRPQDTDLENDLEWGQPIALTPLSPISASVSSQTPQTLLHYEKALPSTSSLLSSSSPATTTTTMAQKEEKFRGSPKGMPTQKIVSPTFSRPGLPRGLVGLSVERPLSTPAELTQRPSRAFSGPMEIEPTRSSSAFHANP